MTATVLPLPVDAFIRRCDAMGGRQLKRDSYVLTVTCSGLRDCAAGRCILFFLGSSQTDVKQQGNLSVLLSVCGGGDGSQGGVVSGHSLVFFTVSGCLL